MATMNLFNGSLAEQFGAQPLLLIHGLIFVAVIALTFIPATGRQY